MERFTFGIPLVSRRAARDWGRIERLLGMTLRSLLAQSDPRFEIVIAGHDRPACLPSDARVVFVRADVVRGNEPRGSGHQAGRRRS